MIDSPVIILDEPTTGLDPLALTKVKSLIKREKNKGKLIIITSHIINFIEEVSDKIIFLLDGNIFYSGSQQLLLKKTGQKKLELAIASIINNNKNV